MKLIILYQPKSEHSTAVEAYARDFEHQHDLEGGVELVSVDSPEGADMARLYDILVFPSILALANDGSILNVWRGEPLPLMNEVAGYMFS